jgi:ABC-type Fe3+ transport system permease subunit
MLSVVMLSDMVPLLGHRAVYRFFSRLWCPKGRHDTQHNDIQHNNKQNVTLSTMALSIMAVLLCCVSYMPHMLFVTKKPFMSSVIMLNVVMLSVMATPRVP